jgi:hypothetical protein
LIPAATAVESGWRPLYLGTNLPAGDIVAAVEHYGARAVVLRLIQGAKDAHVDRELFRLRRKLLLAVCVLVCCGDGRNQFDNDDSNVITVPRLNDFRHCLESLPKSQLH